MSIKALAEMVILQAVEDSCNPVFRKDSLEFFAGEGFSTCCELAGIDTEGKIRLIEMVAKAKPKQRAYRQARRREHRIHSIASAHQRTAALHFSPAP